MAMALLTVTLLLATNGPHIILINIMAALFSQLEQLAALQVIK
jgi:hypothetical protein